MRSYVTLMGRSVWGLVNSVWAAAVFSNYIPSRVVIFTKGCDVKQADQAGKMAHVVLREFGVDAKVEVIVSDRDDIKELAKEMREVFEAEKKLGNDVALDVTSGTKHMALAGMLATAGTGKGWDHVFYLHLPSLRNADRPFLEIPLNRQHHHDILKEAK